MINLNLFKKIKQSAPRGFLCSVLALLFVGPLSSTASAQVDAAVDHRYDLLPYNMPPILTSDAKACASLMQKIEDLQPSEKPILQNLYGNVQVFWKNINTQFIVGKDGMDVLPSGGDAATVKSILPGGQATSFLGGKACGEYAGGAIVNIGILSVRESIDVALASDPKVFERQGADMAQVNAGIEMIDGLAANLSRVPVNDMVDCVAIFQAAKSSNAAMQGQSTIWIAAMVDSIKSGRLNPTSIREQSAIWRALHEGGPKATLEVEGLKAKSGQCLAWTTEAMAAVAPK